MKNVLTAILLTFVIASCSSSTGSDDYNTRFGTWEKVSYDQGNYVGLQGHHGKVVAYKRKADTTAIDTSFIDDAGSISMTIKPISYNFDYSFDISVTDSAPEFSFGHFNIKYVTDSTSIVRNPSGGHLENRESYSTIGTRMYNSCEGIQAKNEYLVINAFSRDSTEHKVYKVRVDGMKDIAEDLVTDCMNDDNKPEWLD